MSTAPTAITTTQRVTIRPYIDPNADNMGLVKHGQTVFANIYHEEPITCLEQYGIRRYVTGLDEFAPEVDILLGDAKVAKVKEIRKLVAYLEQRLGGQSHLDPTAADFWDRVKVLQPDNDAFWGQIKLICGNDPIVLDPNKDPNDLIKYLAIEAGSFSMIAPSLEAARKATKTPKFYLDKLEDTLSITTELKKMRNKAGALLESLFEKNFNKLFYVAKVIDANSSRYRKNTAKDIFYDNMDKFLEGSLDSNTSKRKNAERFILVAGHDMETLRLTAIMKDATYLRLIAARSDGGIYEMGRSSLMGKNQDEVLAFLRNPLNDDILRELTEKVEAAWSL